jgi:hypothetical protein
VTRTERVDESKATISNDSKDRESSARRRQERPQHDGEDRDIPDALCGMLTREGWRRVHNFESLTIEVCRHIQPDLILLFFVAASTRKSDWNDSNSDSKFGAVVAASPFP